MKTQSVFSPSFQGGIKVNKSVTPELTRAIKKSPAMKRLGLFYNAEVVNACMGGWNRNDISCSGLSIENIKPRNVFVAMFDFLTGRQARRYNVVNFNSGKETEAGLIKVLGKMKKNSFLKMVTEKKY